MLLLLTSKKVAFDFGLVMICAVRLDKFAFIVWQELKNFSSRWKFVNRTNTKAKFDTSSLM